MTPINLTPAAEQQLNLLLESNPDLHVRVSVNNKGCSGHSYEWDLVQEQNIHKLDLEIQLARGKFVVSANSLLKLWGSTLDYHVDELGSQFVWQNPNVKNTCGCGISVGF
jgi:iron-sulfur cluster assembly 1